MGAEERPERRLVVAANRGPVSFHSDPSGDPVITRGPGGLVTVLTELLRKHPGTWVATALGEEEERLAGGAVDVELDGDAYRVRYVAVDREVYNKYYNIIANPMLWFIQHYLWDLGRHPDISPNEVDAWWNGYVPVQRLFAAAVSDELAAAGRGVEALAMLHDYHLYGVAPLVREAVPHAFIHQFVHIPWAQSDAWLVLPEAMRTAVFTGLLGNDIVAFHTRHYAVNFLQGCRDLLDLEVDERRLVVRTGEREVWVRAYPVSIDPQELVRASTAQRVVAEEEALLQRRREFLVLRVDRLDLSKNIIRGFLAFDRFLDLHPEFKDRITFLALLQPSREDVEEYVVYRERVVRTVEQINTKHGNTDWMPIDLRIEDNFPQTLAAYRHYRRPRRQRDLRRHEPGRQGGPRGERPRRRPHPQREHRRLRGARHVRRAREPLRHRAAGRGLLRGPHDAGGREARPRRSHAPRGRHQQHREVGGGAVRRHRRQARRRRRLTKVRAPVPGRSYHHCMIIEVLGIDCDQTAALEGAVVQALADLGLSDAATVRRISDPTAIIARGVRRWPGLSVDGKVVSRGSVPSAGELRGFIADAMGQRPADSSR